MLGIGLGDWEREEALNDWGRSGDNAKGREATRRTKQPTTLYSRRRYRRGKSAISVEGNLDLQDQKLVRGQSETSSGQEMVEMPNEISENLQSEGRAISSEGRVGIRKEPRYGNAYFNDG